jgi:hypothetical protein
VPLAKKEVKTKLKVQTQSGKETVSEAVSRKRKEDIKKPTFIISRKEMLWMNTWTWWAVGN